MSKTPFSDKVIVPVLQAQSPPEKTQNEAATWLNRKKGIRKGNRHTRNPMCKKNIFNIWNKNERVSSSFT